MLKILFLLFISLILFLNLQTTTTVFAQGTVNCLSGGTDAAGKVRCTNSTTNSCDAGFIPPSCQSYATQTNSCPFSLDCIAQGTTATPAPTSTPGIACGGQSQKCCGAIPPLYCSGGLVASDPNVPASCMCYAPTSTPTPTVKSASGGATGSPPPGGKGVSCDYQGTNGILTALGCVPTDPAKFVTAISQLATGAGGGIALLLMIAGVFRMMTSAGNPDGVKAGSEQFTSALIGLLFIIFAVLLLKVIGVDILNIPGFIGPS